MHPRPSANGSATYTPVTTASNDNAMQKVATNCAPAISKDGSTLYVTVANSSQGDLVALRTSDLGRVNSVRLKDPHSGGDAWVNSASTASPTVGPDGDVYMGVLEDQFPFNHDRGWMLHFDSTLNTQKPTGNFGWDATASVVAASMVPSYNGSSNYLLMTKYNNYAGVSGDGNNKLAILDPNQTQTDPQTGATIMKEILTITGATPDPDYTGTFPNAVREWCINAAAVDPASHSILANSEDGKMYRWSLDTNSLSEVVTLTAGVGEAYTPTIVGADGTVYAINNGTLYAIVPEPASGLVLVGFGLVAMRRWRRQ